MASLSHWLQGMGWEMWRPQEHHIFFMCLIIYALVSCVSTSAGHTHTSQWFSFPLKSRIITSLNSLLPHFWSYSWYFKVHATPHISSSLLIFWRSTWWCQRRHWTGNPHLLLPPAQQDMKPFVTKEESPPSFNPAQGNIENLAGKKDQKASSPLFTLFLPKP